VSTLPSPPPRDGLPGGGPHGTPAGSPEPVARPAGPGGRRILAKAGILLALLVAAVLAARLTAIGPFFSRPHLQALLASLGLLGPLAHVALFAMGTTLLVPAPVFIAVGAVLFGESLGLLLNLLGELAGAALAFLVSRRLGRELVARWLPARFLHLDARAERQGFWLILYLRLAWVPFIPLNYAAGLTRMRFRDFLAATALGMIPATLILTLFVDDLASLRSLDELPSARFAFPVVLFALSWLLPLLVRRRMAGAAAGSSPRTD
jgi:uncharacterized membrane protein YdjX (TVP38/TMEM64 family)